MPRMPLSGVRISCDTIARKRDLARLAASAWSRATASACSASTRSVTSRPTLCISAGAIGAHRDFAPGDPAGSVPGRDFLIAGARAVGHHAGLALRHDGQGEGGGDQLGAGASGQRTKGVVDVADRAGGIAAHDQVVLRLEEARSRAPGPRGFPSCGRRLRRDAPRGCAARLPCAGCVRSGCSWRRRRRRTVTPRRSRTYMDRNGPRARSPRPGSRTRLQTT